MFAARSENPRVVGSIPTLATILALVALAACGSRKVAPHRPDTAALEREIPGLLRVSGVPGLSMAVVQNGRVVWAEAFGTVIDSAQTPLNPGTVFEAASLSKPVFAYLVLRLADRGEFDLDRPLYEMLEYPRLAHDERYKGITARIVLAALAIEVLQQAIADSPTSAATHLALGRALEAAGDLPAAIASYRRALNADPDEAQRRIQWAEDRVAARARPVAVSQQMLERYAGQYQQQLVAVRNGRLYYKGAVSPESPLTAIATDLFEVDADPAVRIRFVGPESAPAVKLFGIYSDGTIDEWPRSISGSPWIAPAAL